MITFIIRFVKKNPFLYNLAKRVNGRLNRNSIPAVSKNVTSTYYAYIIKNLNELETVKKKYEDLQKYNTKLFVLVDNPNYNIMMHKLIRENPDISFASFDYFKKYSAKLTNNNFMWLNYSETDGQLLDYLV